MLKGIANIIEWIKSNETENWRIRQNQSGDIIFSSPGILTLTVDDTIHELQRRLEIMEPGVYYLEAWKHNVARNDWRKTRFNLEGNSAGVSSVPAIQGFSKDEVEEKIQKEINNYEIRRVNEDLRRENEELKSRYDNVMTRILERAEPYIGTILQGLFPNAAKTNTSNAISGLNDNQNMGNIPLNKRAEKAIEEWYQTDNEAIVLLEKIVSLAKNKPGMYKQAKTLLLSQ